MATVNVHLDRIRMSTPKPPAHGSAGTHHRFPPERAAEGSSAPAAVVRHYAAPLRSTHEEALRLPTSTGVFPDARPRQDDQTVTASGASALFAMHAAPASPLAPRMTGGGGHQLARGLADAECSSVELMCRADGLATLPAEVAR